MAARTIGSALRQAASAAETCWPRRPGLVAAIYHRVGGRTPSPVDLRVDEVRAQFEWVAASSNAVTWPDGVQHNRGVALTFDDGTVDWIDTVLPLLEEFSLPAIFFVATDFIDRQEPFPDEGRPLSWGALRELSASPLVTVGSHTASHRVLGRCDAATTDDELRRSIERVEHELQRPCVDFAYPRAVLGSAAAEVVVRRRCATAALAGGGANPDPIDPYRVVRVPLSRRDAAGAAIRKLSGRDGRVEGQLRAIRDRRR